MSIRLSDIAHNGARSSGDIEWSPTGDLATASLKENLKQAILRLLVTVPGSLLHRPAYGAGLLVYQNAPMSLDAQRRIITAISNEVAKDKRVLAVNEVSISSEDDTPQNVLITVKVEAEGYESLSFDFRPFNSMVG